MPELVGLVGRSLSEETATEFEARVERQAARLREAVAAGDLDNDEFAVGLEMEVYAVEDSHALAALPEAVFESGATKELGVHNAEINTDPDVFDADGLATQAASIEAGFDAARAAAREHGRELVLDAMWTLPPAEGSHPYLAAVDDREGVVVAENMRTDPRYVAIDNDVLDWAGGSLSLSVPGVDCEFPSILFESLATSIQPHLQIPTAESFPAYYNAAIRTLGPVLALSTNAPFLPPDLYGGVADPEGVVAATHDELRIAVFEQSVNVSPNAKVCVPQDIDAASDVVDHVVADDLYAPFLREWLVDATRDSFAGRYWEFDYKRSTYWRWLRCVLGGDPVGTGDERSLRIEYRPIPTQPTVRDVVGMQWLVAGLVRGLVAADHPIADLPRAAAERSFYSAAESGLDADLAWLTADGERTSDPDRIFEELFAHAREGLAAAGVPAAETDRYLDPIEARWEAGLTPSGWKKERVRERLAAGQDLGTAIRGMQRAYVEKSRETGSFAEWV